LGDGPRFVTPDQIVLDLSLEYHNLLAHFGFRKAQRFELVGKPAAFRLPEANRFLAVTMFQLGCTPFDVAGARGNRKKHDFARCHCVQGLA
jgi:hypothetical protein